MISCSTSNEVASNKRIQKRKYTKGYFFDFNRKIGGLSMDQIADNKADDATPAVSDEKLSREITKEVIAVDAKSTVVEQPVSVVESAPVTELSIAEAPTNQLEAQSVEADKSDVEFTTNEEIKAVNEADFKFMKKYIKSKKRALKSKDASSEDAILYYLLAIFIPFLAVGLVTNWDLKQVLINVLLCCLCGLPGIIHALIVVSRNV